MDPTTTEHDAGLPTWPRWRVLYMAWKSAADSRARLSVLRLAAAQVRARIVDRAN